MASHIGVLQRSSSPKADVPKGEVIDDHTLGLIKHFETLERSRVALSPIVLGELQVGYDKGDRTPGRLAVIETLRSCTEILMITSEVANTYAQLRAQLEQTGKPIGPNATWIAAEALHHHLVLVTDNTCEFSRVPGLQIENRL